MAGAVVTLTDMQADRLAAKLDRGLQGVDFTPLWPVINVMLQASAKKNFDRGAAPDGTAWLSLKKPRTRNKKGKGAGSTTGLPLRDTGKLMASMAAASAGHYEKRGPLSLEWGTNVNYAAYHQYGTRTIPARPYLGWTDQLADDVAAAIQDFIADKLV